jgi:hypothetical protein
MASKSSTSKTPSNSLPSSESSVEELLDDDPEEEESAEDESSLDESEADDDAEASDDALKEDAPPLLFEDFPGTLVALVSEPDDPEVLPELESLSSSDPVFSEDGLSPGIFYSKLQCTL